MIEHHPLSYVPRLSPRRLGHVTGGPDSALGQMSENEDGTRAILLMSSHIAPHENVNKTPNRWGSDPKSQNETTFMRSVADRPIFWADK